MRGWRCLKNQHFTMGRYKISPVSPSHIESIRCWRNDQMDVLRQAEIISSEHQCDYFSKNIWPTMEHNQPSNILVGFLYDEILIGYGGLVHIAWEHRRAEISFLLETSRSLHESTYAKDFNVFLQLIQSMAFEDLDLHRLFAETYSNRYQHIKILEEAGFKLEGILHQHVLIKGIYLNSLIHGLINKYEK